MHDEQAGHTPDAALTELRRRLEGGMARTRLKKTDLVARTGLSRTTVQLAFQTDGPVPSGPTVAALARVLKLPVGELLELRRTAAQKPDTVPTGGPGRPIGQWDPHALEVHPAGSAQDSTGLPGQRLLPGYVPREHDRILTEAVQDAAAGHSRILVLVGSSSTGKTRACWEAVQPLAEQAWRLWHPFDPTRAEAALEDLARVAPRTVVWLNEAQHYLGDPGAGERIAAALHALLTTPERAPVLVLGTLWDDYARQYAALPTPGGPDPHSRVRELLSGRTLMVPDTFDAQALATAAALAQNGDWLLADALTRAAASGRVAQDLAGAPELLTRYQQATPAAKAILQAAMDARRHGVGLHLPQAFLTAAAADYLTDTDWNQLNDDWAEKAYAELAEQVHGKQAPLSRGTPRPRRRPPRSSAPTDLPPSRPSRPVATPTPNLLVGPAFRLADYLEQHGSKTRGEFCPPDSFWDAAHTHLTGPGDLNNLAQAAEFHRLPWAHHLRQRAALTGHKGALIILTTQRLHAREQVIGVGRRDKDLSVKELLDRFLEERRAFAVEALTTLAMLYESAGGLDTAEVLHQSVGDPAAVQAMLQQIHEAERAQTLASFLANIR
ncbi:helix-turn-helix transcriptional regulator [Streptomyces griseomycini]|uniref:helix-turn-helix domain-containing protein n=1 Tax=Streptomyces griseomycini TaxID=66895 RepID=UPI003422B75A